MNTILTTINSFAILGGAIAVVVLQYRSKAKEVSNEVIQNYERLERQLKDQKQDLERQLKEQAQAHSAEIAVLHKAMGEKDATIKIQEKMINEYKTIIANRNPELEKVLSQIKDFMERIENSLIENKEISAANAKELKGQTEMMQTPKAVILTGEVQPQTT